MEKEWNIRINGRLFEHGFKSYQEAVDFLAARGLNGDVSNTVVERIEIVEHFKEGND